jgi:hypothetical protein
LGVGSGRARVLLADRRLRGGEPEQPEGRRQRERADEARPERRVGERKLGTESAASTSSLQRDGQRDDSDEGYESGERRAEHDRHQ